MLLSLRVYGDKTVRRWLRESSVPRGIGKVRRITAGRFVRGAMGAGKNETLNSNDFVSEITDSPR